MHNASTKKHKKIISTNYLSFSEVFLSLERKSSWTRRDIPRHAFSLEKKRPGVAKRNENYFLIMAHCLFFLAPRQGHKRTRLWTRPFEPATSCFFEKKIFFSSTFSFCKKKRLLQSRRATTALRAHTCNFFRKTNYRKYSVV